MPTPEEVAAKAVEEATKDASAEEAKETPAADPHEAAARAKGWKPKEEYTGDAALWVDAKEFLGREPLFEKIRTQSKELKDIKRTVEAMAKHQAAIVEHTVNARIAALKAERKVAIEEADVDKVEKIDKAIEEQKEVRASSKDKEVPGVIQEWVEANSWYKTDAEMRDFARAYNDSYLKRHPDDLEGSLDATLKATKRAFPEKFPEEKKPPTPPAHSVEGSTAPNKGAAKYSVSRLTPDQKLAHDQYIKAGTFDDIAKKNKMTPSEYYVRQLDEIGELSR
jgi:hypothetical protein